MPKQPNILILTSDQQQGATCDTDHPCRLPNLGKLAREGLRFSRAYTPMALCGPARASLMTGRYPTGHGMLNNYHSPPVLRCGLNPGIPHFSECLREAGYNLSYVGKWHVSGETRPSDHGWHEPHPGESLAEVRRRLGVSGANWVTEAGSILKRPGWPDRILDGISDIPLEAWQDYHCAVVAVAELRRLAEHDKPWCLFVGWIAPHDPFIAPRCYAQLYRDSDVELPANFHDDLADKPAIYRRQKQMLWSGLSQADYRRAISRYWAMCTMLDDLVGMMLAVLDETGQADNTLVVYSSDHGDMAGGHGLFLKGIMPFEETYRVPLIMRWPAGIASPGRVVTEFVTWNDLGPTFCDIAGAPPLIGAHGTSLAPILAGQQPIDWPKELFLQFTSTEYYYTQRIINDGRYKYVFNGFDFDELYDLREDPNETVNLAHDPVYAGEIERLCELMWAWFHRAEDVMYDPYPTVSLLPRGPEGLGLDFSRKRWWKYTDI
jgi:arylsulfatase A-like enzyme